MKLADFMDDAYQGLAKGRRLKARQGDMIFRLEDLADRVGTKPSRNAVEELVPDDESLLRQLAKADPGKKYQLLWGYLSSIAAERSPEPLLLPARDYVGLELTSGCLQSLPVRPRQGGRRRSHKLLRKISGCQMDKRPERRGGCSGRVPLRSHPNTGKGRAGAGGSPPGVPDTLHHRHAYPEPLPGMERHKKGIREGIVRALLHRPGLQG